MSSSNNRWLDFGYAGCSMGRLKNNTNAISCFKFKGALRRDAAERSRCLFHLSKPEHGDGSESNRQAEAV